VIAEIRAAIAAGRCVCWVRNTVADAIETSSSRSRGRSVSILQMPLMDFAALCWLRRSS